MTCSLIDQNHVEFQHLTTLRALKTCRFRASSIQVNPYAKKSQRIFLFLDTVSFCFYIETAGKHKTWTKHKLRFVLINGN